MTSVTFSGSGVLTASIVNEGIGAATTVIIEGYTSIGSNAFQGSSLTSVLIPNSVTSIGFFSFQGCLGLTSITIPNSVTNIIIYAFHSCSNLSSVTFEPTSQITDIGGYSFANCSSLSSITIPDSVTSIGADAFASSGLTTVTISAATGATLNKAVPATNIDFFGKSGVNTVLPPPPPPVTFTGSGELTASIVNEGIGAATTVIIVGYTSIGMIAFENKPQITSITIPNSVTSIGVGAFQGCSGLTSITIPNSVTSIENYAFSLCTGVTSITFAPTSHVTIIDYNAFQYCSSLTSITIPNSVTSMGDSVFSWCTSLTSVTFESTSQVTSIGSYAFYYCSSLSSIKIPDSVTSIGSNAFLSSGLTTVTISTSTATTLNKSVPATSIEFFGKSGVNTVRPPRLISNICFIAGTPVTTDQGNIPIEKIDTTNHTIRNKKIVAITQTVTQDKYLVCFEKDALGKNIPSQQTIISKNHKLFYNGKMRNAKEFLKDFDNVTKVKYTGAILYNVLLEQHDKMMVNNLICETLDTKNGVAKVYMALQKLDTDGQQSLIQKINAHVIKNDVFNSKKAIKKAIK